jgi:protocatechuate 3,4-dioxygenase beta subunit
MNARLCVAGTWAASLAVAMCLAEPSLAQVLVEGRVLDNSTERPVARARVLLVNRYNKTAGYTLTDAGGRFRFATRCGVIAIWTRRSSC